MEQEDLRRTASSYRRFSEVEAAGKSPLYAALALAVASDPEILKRLVDLPSSKRQPNLLFACYRWHHGLPCSPREFRSRLLEDWARISSSILNRSTQTNEPGRCAVLMPLLATLPQPLALIEVGAAAGLCLYPDRYGYSWNGCELTPPDIRCAPKFTCATNAATPIPSSYPEIVWRGGLDLHPLNVASPDDMRWLETLVWPGNERRRERLKMAIKIAQSDPPQLSSADLLEGLASLIGEAPANATKVVFHSAVLNYVMDLARRNEFAETVLQLSDIWIANEAPSVFPDIIPRSAAPQTDAFHLTLNGESIAWTDPHGTALWWMSRLGVR